MALVNEQSLAQTLNKITHAWLTGTQLSADDRIDAARWIAARVGIAGSYSGLPAPTEVDYGDNVYLYTGETVRSNAGIGCKLGFEAVWALAQLNVHDAAVRQATLQAQARTLTLFDRQPSRAKGMYCCYSCSQAGWRALATIEGGQPFLTLGVELLHNSRDGKGRWAKFPFWYSVLALTHNQTKAARAEIQYAAPALERFLRRKDFGQLHDARRELLAQKALGIA